MKWGRIALDAFKEVKDNAQLVGAGLIASGVGLQLFVPELDFVIWDFSGNHMPPAQTQLTPADPTKPPDKTANPTPLQIFNSFFLGTLSTFPGMFLFTGQQGAETPFGNATSALGNEVNIFSIMGIKLPTQIRLSEILILAGLFGVFSPLLQAVGSSLSGIIGKALPAL